MKFLITWAVVILVALAIVGVVMGVYPPIVYKILGVIGFLLGTACIAAVAYDEF